MWEGISHGFLDEPKTLPEVLVDGFGDQNEPPLVIWKRTLAFSYLQEGK